MDGLKYIIPSKVFTNFEDFINTLKIPYYDDGSYTIKVVEDGDNCFNNIKMNKLIFLFIMIFILI